MKDKIKQWITGKMAIFYGNRISLDRKLKNATARITFVGNEKYGGSIKIELDGMIYYFEGKPEIKKHKNFEGKQVVQKTLKYGGWEMDIQHKNNKLFK